MEKQKSTYIKYNERPPIKTLPEKLSYPLSFQQKEIWIENKIKPNNPFWNICYSRKIKGKLNVNSFIRALKKLLERHRILRTRFNVVNDNPCQIINPLISMDLYFSYIDFSYLSKSEAEIKIRFLIDQEAHTTLNLHLGPLFNVKLFKIADFDHVFFINMHHIISDEMSLEIIWKELVILYNFYNGKSLITLPQNEIQYHDFVIWQQDVLNSKYLKKQEKYWKNQFKENINNLNLSLDYYQPINQNRRGALEISFLNREFVKKLCSFSFRNKSTFFITLLAAYYILLHRYSNQDDIVVGVPFAGRHHSKKTLNIVGLFVNILPICINLNKNPTLYELIHQLRDKLIEGHANQDFSFQEIVRIINPERSLSHTTLFQVMFNLIEIPNNQVEIDGLNVKEWEVVELSDVKYDLILNILIYHEYTKIIIQYCTDRFTKQIINKFIIHYKNILLRIIENPNTRLSELKMLKEYEKNEIFEMCNGKIEKWKIEKNIQHHVECVYQLFENQVVHTPNAVAVTYKDKQLTYCKLNQSANQLAHYLRSLGIGPEILVGICVERSLEMIIGILGILKAGGVYVPIDPDYPRQRLSSIIDDAKISIMLTQKKFKDILTGQNTDVVYIDTFWDKLSIEKNDNIDSNVQPENLAYVIYTSGSTGKPKGVMNTHRGLINRLLWMQETFHLTSQDRVLQKTPFTFDVSVWEFLWPLITGATLAIAKPEGHKDRDYLVDVIKKEKITTIHFVPSMLSIFLDNKNLDQCNSLKMVICSGEVLSAELKNRFYEKINAELYNLYGPTEASIDVTYYKCERESNNHIVPIGKPIYNTQIYILNKYLHPVPIGVIGEIHIGGVGLARGYLNRSELTAEKFIKNPFSNKPDERLYKTGDLGRYLPDGNIEFIGRMDDQVKIRGFRVELQEIEVILSQHPSVKECVVICRNDNKIGSYMIAYVVLNHNGAMQESELRSYLKDKLPDYMVPSFVTFLDALPLTPNGKVNTKALPIPDKKNLQMNTGFVKPRNHTEQTIADIWLKILDIKEVGIYNNFFDLGGHSLLAIQVVSRIRDQFQVEVPLHHFFNEPTINGLVKHIKKAIATTMIINSNSNVNTNKREVTLI